jgi:hypothetical protein
MTDMKASTSPGNRRGFYIAYQLNSEISTTRRRDIDKRLISEPR